MKFKDDVPETDDDLYKILDKRAKRSKGKGASDGKRLHGIKGQDSRGSRQFQ
jgi:hypothetical protein